MFKPSPANIMLILLGAGINIFGRYFAKALVLPVWLDSVGTFLTAVLLGPIAGAISGAIMNLITGIFELHQAWFAIVSIAGGIAVGRFFPRDKKIDSFSVIATALFAGLVMTVVSTPLNMYFNHGLTGNEWGDALVKMMGNYISLKVVCTVAGELLVNMPDKAVSIGITMLTLFIVRKYRDKNSGQKNDTAAPMTIFFIAALTGAALLTGAVSAKASDIAGEYMPVIYSAEDGLI
ncbi:MAG: ECF transporter S component, partial [Lachnospiraceae bacterium]|nr:ECF transporter S component [Lachnospiraceae bacterium]